MSDIDALCNADGKISMFACTENGVFIWPGEPVVELRGGTFVRATDRFIFDRATVFF